MDFGTIAINTLLTMAAVGIPALFATGWRWLGQRAAEIDIEWLSALTGRTVAVADSVTGAAFARFDELTKLAQAPESDGGETITKSEWQSILDALWLDFKGGFGESWVTRAIGILGAAAFEAQSKAEIAHQLTAKLDEKRATNAEAGHNRAVARSTPPLP